MLRTDTEANSRRVLQTTPHYSCTAAVDNLPEHECLLAFEEPARVQVSPACCAVQWGFAHSACFDQRCEKMANDRDVICEQMLSKRACKVTCGLFFLSFTQWWQGATKDHRKSCEQALKSFRWQTGVVCHLCCPTSNACDVVVK